MYLNFRNIFHKHYLIECFSKKFSLKSWQDGMARISDVLTKHSEGKIAVKGWIKHIRIMKKDFFVDVNDGSSCKDLQIIVSKGMNQKLAVGDSIEAWGMVGLSPKNVPEIIAEKIKILGRGNISDYPFTPKQEHPPEYAREYLHLRPRLRNMSSLLRVRHKALNAIQTFLDNRGFVHIHTPILTSNDCEGAGEIFTVKPDIQKGKPKEESSSINQANNYFDKAFLSVSGQFHLEAISHSLGHTYTLNPAFRAENSKSPLHLCEFYMLEAEMAFCTDIIQLTDLIELLIKTVTEKLITDCEEDITACTYSKNKRVSPSFSWISQKWPVISYDDAYKILLDNKQQLKTRLDEREGFSKEQELFLVNNLQSPVFVINWSKSSKPFYMKEIPENPDKVYALDLLAPNVGELVGGGLREDDYIRLEAKIPKDIEWYLDLRKFGGIPTGGFGLGFERYLQLITGITNIKDVIPFPRWAHNCNM